ncbi:phosphotransferase family protein [Hydrogenophaga sp.]|uniref:phosphotransferase family protein n=1 Tax=Hydrogenophaga sp. TaxID=1904254 RepID=UPI0026075C37|nr:phosphotransferase family protein [Hydrogenophaga sp.]MCW5652114.1 phosphotransferase family protein [Hydrogenophaga sp.]
MNDPLHNDDLLRERIQRYLQEQTGQAVEIGALKRFAVGFSWRTYLVPVSGLKDMPETRELILRLGPDYGLFAPYSAMPEWLAMRSLEGSEVPLPKAYWAGDDPSLFGAPFLFGERMAGAAVVPWVPAGTPPLDEGYRRSLGAQFIDALAALHRVDWRHKPIAAMGEGIDTTNAALRNVAYWEQRIAQWAMRPYPAADWAVRWLKEHCPVAPRVSIVHGDYRTGNFLEENGRITAILDWELVHLGDPHEDLGWASLPMYMGGSKFISRLCEPEWFYERYSEKAGFEVSMDSVRYYRAFSLLKLAATHMAAARCFEEGRFNDMRMPAMGSQIGTCLRQLEKTIEAKP